LSTRVRRNKSVHNFEYVAAHSLDQALTRLAQGGADARIMAGGTDLIVQMRERRRHVPVVIDVKAVPEMTEVLYDPQRGLRLGAATPCYKIYHDEAVAKAYPCLIDSASLIGGTAIQGRASLGGNLCNSSPAADSSPTLIVLSATCVVAGPGGERRVPVEDFCVSPGRNVLQPGEVLVAFELPPPTPKSGARFLRFIPRNEMDIAVVNAASWVQLDVAGQTITSARIAIGAVAPTPLRLYEAEQAITGAPATEETYARAAEIAAGAARPIADMRGTVAQRRHLSSVLVRRTLAGAVERARKN